LQYSLQEASLETFGYIPFYKSRTLADLL